jgi:hypothetical protein
LASCRTGVSKPSLNQPLWILKTLST